MINCVVHITHWQLTRVSRGCSSGWCIIMEDRLPDVSNTYNFMLILNQSWFISGRKRWETSGPLIAKVGTCFNNRITIWMQRSCRLWVAGMNRLLRWWWELVVLCMRLTDLVGWGLQACSPAARSLFTYYLVSYSPLFFLNFLISCNVTTKEIKENSHDTHLRFWWWKPFSIAARNIEHPLYPLRAPVEWESQFINSHPSCHCAMFRATKCTGVTRSCIRIPSWPWSP